MDGYLCCPASREKYINLLRRTDAQVFWLPKRRAHHRSWVENAGDSPPCKVRMKATTPDSLWREPAVWVGPRFETLQSRYTCRRTLFLNRRFGPSRPPWRVQPRCAADAPFEPCWEQADSSECWPVPSKPPRGHKREAAALESYPCQRPASPLQAQAASSRLLEYTVYLVNDIVR